MAMANHKQKTFSFQNKKVFRLTPIRRDNKNIIVGKKL